MSSETVCGFPPWALHSSLLTHSTRCSDYRFSVSFRKRVIELVEMLSFDDLNRHLARESHQLTGARVRHDGDAQFRCTSCHRAIVLECEGAIAAVQFSVYPLDGHVASRALDVRHGAQHLALAGRFQIAGKFFVDRHPAEVCAFGLLIVRLLRS